jgi:hypothetical protein
MKQLISLSLAALIAVTAVIPASSTVAEARRGRNIAIGAGIILGAAALAAAANSNRAYAGDREYRSYSRSSGRSGFWERCRRWYRQCDRGNDYACEKYETRGCTE